MKLIYACTTARISIAFLGCIEDLETAYKVEMKVLSFDGNRQGEPTECSCIHLEIHGADQEVKACHEYALALKVDGENPFSPECPKKEHLEPNPEFVIDLNQMISLNRG